MADSKNDPNINQENPSLNSPPAAPQSNDVAAMNEDNNNQGRQSRTPFTDLSQVDADLALARTLQEQERAYMMIQMNGGVSDYGRWESGSYVPEDDDLVDHSEDEYEGSDAGDDHEHDLDHESEDYDDDEDAFDVHAHEDGDHEDNPNIELDPADFPNDEAYARALQDAEDRDMASRLLALSGINEMVASGSEELEDHGRNSQDAWEEVDPDELSYEELIALGDVVGTESRGLSADTIASLPSMSFKMQKNQDGNIESCVICRLDFEEGDTLTVLACKHSYHPECINNWLCINKVCPVCSAEVSTSGNS
ncbi:E3 ubiquitin ligase BIG BROTHER-related [Heracleum sosnowskyi]|uniref:E3 ubiquitin ligase BIG BROTHER-related n=1 Tax=Heracleum sosnowskyi TaxID=360622 RepID=A0AAD8IR22_9APIA|nr:E3 ubiquitin ligase BIG BROTHER-related [Heracleum sosnowskyi]